ncbi:hypothetical protein D3C86_1198280 [compost metagenome]
MVEDRGGPVIPGAELDVEQRRLVGVEDPGVDEPDPEDRPEDRRPEDVPTEAPDPLRRVEHQAHHPDEREVGAEQQDRHRAEARCDGGRCREGHQRHEQGPALAGYRHFDARLAPGEVRAQAQEDDRAQDRGERQQKEGRMQQEPCRLGYLGRPLRRAQGDPPLGDGFDAQGFGLKADCAAGTHMRKARSRSLSISPRRSLRRAADARQVISSPRAKRTGPAAQG